MKNGISRARMPSTITATPMIPEKMPKTSILLHLNDFRPAMFADNAYFKGRHLAVTLKIWLCFLSYSKLIQNGIKINTKTKKIRF